MIRSSVMAIAALFPLLAVADTPANGWDVLRFTNGDQLHGTFMGMAEGPRAIWKRDDVVAPIEIAPAQVRQIVLNGGRPLKALKSLSNVALINGDKLPGVLKSFDDQSVVIETSYAGQVTIPRAQVALIAPSPLGGRLIYHGPYAADEWTMITSSEPDGVKGEALKSEDERAAAPGPGRWLFAGSAWYWQNAKAGTALVRKDGMPDRAMFRFTAAWKGHMTLSFAFHADFKRPPPAADPAIPHLEIAELFGGSYVIQINGSNATLYKTGFDKTGKPTLEASRTSSFATRFTDTDQAVFEVRCNRETGEIALFVNDEFVTQWSEGAGETYDGKGSGFGFLAQGPSAIRISEIAMAEWNGMPDSARSLQVEDQDIVLLANGTDRFSGRISGFKDGVISLESKYGAFKFPLDELAEIRFARNRLAKPAAKSGDTMMIQFYPLGRLTGKAVAGGRDHLKLFTPAAGELEVNLDSAVILDFNPSNSLLDDWDAQF